MERAALSLLHLVLRACPQAARHGVRVLVGRGNNGGDGLALARHLSARGVPVQAFLIAQRPDGDARGDSDLNLGLCARRRGSPATPPLLAALPPRYLAESPSFPGLWVDALLGTGFRGELRPGLRSHIEALNRRQENVMSVDVPSGLDACSGRACPVAVRARFTGTLGADKSGFGAPEAAGWTGQVHVLGIGWPARVTRQLLQAP